MLAIFAALFAVVGGVRLRSALVLTLLMAAAAACSAPGHLAEGHHRFGLTRLGTTTGPAHVAGPLQANGATTWSPTKSSPLFCLNPANSATLTISTGVSQATDDCGGSSKLVQATGSAQPTVNGTLGKASYAGLKFLATASQTLYSSTGGITGHADHSICVVGQQDLSTTSYSGWSMFGAPTGSAGAVSMVGYVGATNPTQWGALRLAGPGTPTSATPFAGDAYPHLLCLVFSSQTISLYVDGLLAISAVSDTSYNVGAGFGIDTVGFGIYPTAHVYYSTWWTVAISTATRQSFERWAAHRFQVGNTACLGDSICQGFPAGATEAPLAYLNADYLDHGTQSFNFGIQGQRSDQILGRVSSVTSLLQPGSQVPFVVVLNAGTNDVYDYLYAAPWLTGASYSGGSAVTSTGRTYFSQTASCTSGATAPTCASGSCSDGACTWLVVAPTSNLPALVAFTVSNMQTMATDISALGGVVLLQQMLPVGQGTFGAQTATANAYAALLNAALTGGTVVPVTNAPELVSPASCWYMADQVHPTNVAACTCPLSGLASWVGPGHAYAASAMVQSAAHYYANEAACTSGSVPPTCTSGSCSDGACTWDAIPSSPAPDCTIGGYRAMGRVMAPQVKALLGMSIAGGLSDHRLGPVGALALFVCAFVLVRRRRARRTAERTARLHKLLRSGDPFR